LAGDVIKYASVAVGERLHQGEILAGVIRVQQALASIGAEKVQIDEIVLPFAIILTQDCELTQDADARMVEQAAVQDPSRLDDPEFKKKHESLSKYKIDSIVFCEARSTAELRSVAAQQKELWKRVIQNLDPRFQCLEAIPPEYDAAGQGIPSLGCDFKRFFTLPTDEVYKRIEIGQVGRRTYLLSPYAEHLSQRFYNFQSRIPLPENHAVPL
jgi:hypothetical protein